MKISTFSLVVGVFTVCTIDAQTLSCRETTIYNGHESNKSWIPCNSDVMFCHTQLIESSIDTGTELVNTTIMLSTCAQENQCETVGCGKKGDSGFSCCCDGNTTLELCSTKNAKYTPPTTTSTTTTTTTTTTTFTTTASPSLMSSSQIANTTGNDGDKADESSSTISPEKNDKSDSSCTDENKDKSQPTPWVYITMIAMLAVSLILLIIACVVCYLYVKKHYLKIGSDEMETHLYTTCEEKLDLMDQHYSKHYSDLANEQIDLRTAKNYYTMREGKKPEVCTLELGKYLLALMDMIEAEEKADEAERKNAGTASVEKVEPDQPQEEDKEKL